MSHAAKVLWTTTTETTRVVLSFLICVFRACLASLTFPLSKLIILRTQMPFLHIWLLLLKDLVHQTFSLCLNAVISRCGVEELSILLCSYWVAFWMSWTFIRYFVTLKVLRIDDDDEGFAEVVETQNTSSRRSYFLFVSFIVTCILYWRGVFARVRV